MNGYAAKRYPSLTVQTVSAAPIHAGTMDVTPLARCWTAAWGDMVLVWNRPAALLVTEAGPVGQRSPGERPVSKMRIFDVTKVGALLMVAATVFGGCLIYARSSRWKEMPK